MPFGMIPDCRLATHPESTSDPPVNQRAGGVLGWTESPRWGYGLQSVTPETSGKRIFSSKSPFRAYRGFEPQGGNVTTQIQCSTGIPAVREQRFLLAAGVVIRISIDVVIPVGSRKYYYVGTGITQSAPFGVD